MQYRPFGSTGMRVSAVGFGCWTVSANWWPDAPKDEAGRIRLLRQAYDYGINYYDTADTYGDGLGEEILARAFSGMRDRIIIGTKVGYDWYNHPDRRGQQERPQNWEPSFLRAAVEQSLKRLGTDYIDLLQYHNIKHPDIERDDIWELLQRLQGEGKIRYYGVALGPAIGWKEEGEYALRVRRAHAVMMIYNALEQDPGRDLIAAAAETGAGLQVRVPHSSGMLEGKLTLETRFDKGDHRAHRRREWLENGLKKIAMLEPLYADTGMTLGQFALQFILKSPQIATTLPNIYSEDQLREFSAAPDFPDLSDDVYAAVNRLYDENFGLPRPQYGLV